ncbi:PEP-CTERM sorting domain-containing protein [Methyloversatilis thermotolerans]|uniref:PEP-CTERM sorting domain-containing protein n=1 Tax=Methyloversatilis thermotolerans TaxID=1346290 RepID=UPI00035C5D83|nr:PEP-CTERM sorting domain-containing protein [Methyloversatilis thermotolerans]
MRTPHALLLAVGLAASSLASAASSSLSLTADGDSRWYSYYSAVYAQIDKSWKGSQVADGFFGISSGATVGSGVDVFPNEGNFANIGTLTYANVSNVGLQTASITDLTLNFTQFIDGSAASELNVDYTTKLSNISGTATLYNGALADIDLTASITFTFNASGQTASYTGTFTITDGVFDLYVDSTAAVLGRNFRYVWDVEGSVAGLTTIPETPPVPEPETYAMLLAGLGLIGVRSLHGRRKA